MQTLENVGNDVQSDEVTRHNGEQVLMCFFFGSAAVEITESFLPYGMLREGVSQFRLLV